MTRLRYTSSLPELISGAAAGQAAIEAPDRRDGRLYLLPDELRLAVEVALTTGRPLLLRGAPGSGKSSLAPFVARNLDYRYYEQTVTAASRAQDLLWRFDAVRRLADAQVRAAESPELRDEDYVEPGVLWWAFDRESARRRGIQEERGAPKLAPVEPNADVNGDRRDDSAVVLVDEIDKADPDLPNGLLEPLSAMRFVVHETGAPIARPAGDQAALSRLLVVITTNEERDLPQAF